MFDRVRRSEQLSGSKSFHRNVLMERKTMMAKIVAACAGGMRQRRAAKSPAAECYILREFEWLYSSCVAVSRGVAQPGRAPGSGPGGRRFKSSLPDQSIPLKLKQQGIRICHDFFECCRIVIFLRIRPVPFYCCIFRDGNIGVGFGLLGPYEHRSGKNGTQSPRKVRATIEKCRETTILG